LHSSSFLFLIFVTALSAKTGIYFTTDCAGFTLPAPRPVQHKRPKAAYKKLTAPGRKIICNADILLSISDKAKTGRAFCPHIYIYEGSAFPVSIF